MDPDPWELSAASWLVLLAYCLFRMLWAKLNVVLLCFAMLMIHLVSLHFSSMVSFFYILWNRRLQMGRELMQVLSQKFPMEQLLPTYLTVWENVCVGRTWSLGILFLLLNSARRHTQRMLDQLRNEIGKALHQAAVWFQCSISVAFQYYQQVILRTMLIQIISTLLLGRSENLWSNIGQGIETIRAFQLLEQSTQQQQNSGNSANKEMNKAPNYALLDNHARLNQHFRRCDIRGQSSTCHSPTPSTSTGRGDCHCFAPIFPLNTMPQEGKKTEKKTKKRKQKKMKEEREKKAKEKKEEMEKEKKVEKKEIEDDGKKVEVIGKGGKVSKEEEEAKKNTEVKVGGRKVREEEVVKENMEEGKKNGAMEKKTVEEERGGNMVQEEEVQKPEEKEEIGDKGEKKEVEGGDTNAKKGEAEENNTLLTQQDVSGLMKSLCELISFVYLYAMYIFEK